MGMAQIILGEMGGVGDLIIHTPTSASATSEYSGFPASNAIDGDINTRWSSADTNTLATLTVNFTEAVNINKVITLVRNGSADTARDFSIRVKNGSTEIATLQYSSNEVKTTVCKNFANSAKYSSYSFEFISFPYSSNTSYFCGMAMMLFLGNS